MDLLLRFAFVDDDDAAWIFPSSFLVVYLMTSMPHLCVPMSTGKERERKKERKREREKERKREREKERKKSDLPIRFYLR